MSAISRSEGHATGDDFRETGTFKRTNGSLVFQLDLYNRYLSGLLNQFVTVLLYPLKLGEPGYIYP